MKSRNSGTLIFLCLCALCPQLHAGDVKLAPIESMTDDSIEGYTVTAAGYKARLSKTGQIVSVKLGEMELLDGGIRIGMGGKNEPPAQLKQTGPLSMQLLFPSKPIADYKFDENSIAITVKNQKKSWDFGFYYTLSTHAQTITSKEFGYENLGLPLGKGHTAHWHTSYTYDDGSVLNVDQAGPGNHINGDDNGWFGGFSWSRGQLEMGGTYTFTFSFQRGAPGTKLLSAPPYIVRSERIGNIFNAGEQASFALEFKKEHYQKLLGTVSDTFIECRSRDFWGRESEVQTVPVDFAALHEEDGKSGKVALVPVVLKTSAKGYFDAEFILKDKNGKLIPNKATTSFSIITPTTAGIEGLANLPLDYKAGIFEFDALLGLRCDRQNIKWEDVFPIALNIEKPAMPTTLSLDKPSTKGTDTDILSSIEGNLAGGKEKPKVKELVADFSGLDRQMAAAREAKTKYGMTIFWLIELPKGGVKSAEQLEDGLYKIVSHCKDSNKYWMLFNEPNLAMSPDAYVKTCLMPLHRAAHRADPDAKVMGPDTCGVNPAWLEAVYKAGGEMDIIDMHPYTGHQRGWEEHGMAGAWQAVRTIMAAHGDGAKEIWSTESGYDFALGRLGKAHHARNTIRQYPIAAAAGIPKNHFFLYYTCYVGYLKMYIVDEEKRLLPAAVAARVQSEHLGAGEFAGKQEIGRDKEAYLYRGKTEDVWMVWSHDFKTTFDADLTGRKAVAFDIMGNQLKDDSTAGGGKRRLSYAISGDPIYIHFDRDAKIEPVAADPKTNLARQEGVKASASSEEKPGIAAKVIDGVANAENSSSFEDRAWVSAKSLKDPGIKDAWVEIALPRAQPLSRVQVYAPSSICGLPGLRAFKVQVYDDAKTDWKTVGEVSGADESWVFHVDFAPVTAARVRVLVTDVNNGFKLDDKSDYTDMKPRITEIEIYGAQ